VDYDTPHVKPWGIDMAFYLLTKGIATGAMFLSVMLWLFSSDTLLARVVGPAISLVFLTITAVLLIVDLERPERFYYILIKPNWRSWMVWGAYFLTAQGAITTAWIAAGWFEWRLMLSLLTWPALVMSVLATCYTGFLFAQGLARDLWQGPHAAVDLAAQAVAEGAAVLMLAGLVPGVGRYPALGWILAAALGIHLVFVAFDVLLAPSPTRHHDLAVAAIRRGPFARIFWGGAIACASLGLIGALFTAINQAAPTLALVALLALGGSFAWEYVWVEAGQSVPLS
jgi:formate-dependent nitrite reductase membrane component NrfD